MTYNAEQFLESTVRSLKAYVGNALNESVRNGTGDPVGLYDPNTNPNGPFMLAMEFPSPELLREQVPLVRSIVHLEIDAIDDNVLGFGKGYGRVNYDPASQTWNPQVAAWHRIDFDVGIWTSDRSGGTTARLRLYQTLSYAFVGSLAQKALDDLADVGDGRIEILNFTGGRFLTETVNDVVTYRSVDGMLAVRVFSRTPLVPIAPSPTIEEIIQQPGLVIIE